MSYSAVPLTLLCALSIVKVILKQLFENNKSGNRGSVPHVLLKLVFLFFNYQKYLSFQVFSILTSKDIEI